MGGVFGVAAKKDCVADLFYGTDYHSHLGTRRGGMAVRNRRDFFRSIHDITNAQFRGKFENDLRQMHGSLGIGVISDFEDQPLIIGSHLGTFALATVGRIQNLKKLAAETFRNGATHFSEMEGEGVNPTELVATLINRGATFQEGIGIAQAAIEGSCSLLLLTGWAERRWCSAGRRAPGPSRWRPARYRISITRSTATLALARSSALRRARSRH